MRPLAGAAGFSRSAAALRRARAAGSFASPPAFATCAAAMRIAAEIAAHQRPRHRPLAADPREMRRVAGPAPAAADPRRQPHREVKRIQPQQAPRKQLHRQQHAIALDQLQPPPPSPSPASSRDGAAPPPAAHKCSASPRCARAAPARHRRHTRRNPRRSRRSRPAFSCGTWPRSRPATALPLRDRTGPWSSAPAAAPAILPVGKDQVPHLVDAPRILPDQHLARRHPDVRAPANRRDAAPPATPAPPPHRCSAAR